MRLLSRLTVIFGVAFLVIGCSPVNNNGGDDDDDNDDNGDDDDGGSNQTQTCIQFLACVEAVDPGVLAEQEQLFGPGSACWDNEVDAVACGEACNGGLIAYELLYPTVDICWNDGNPDAQLIFPSNTAWDRTARPSCQAYMDYGETDLRGTSTLEFRMDGSIVDLYQDQWFFETTCTFAARSFNCELYQNQGPTFEWAISGSFHEGFQTAEMMLLESYDGTDYPCEFDGVLVN